MVGALIPMNRNYLLSHGDSILQVDDGSEESERRESRMSGSTSGEKKRSYARD